MLTKGFVMTALFPDAQYSMEAFEAAVRTLYEKGVRCFEYFSCPEQLQEKAKLVRELGGRSVLLGAIAQKNSAFGLADRNPQSREAAVSMLKLLLQQAADASISEILITSGQKPEQADAEPEAEQLFCRSIREVMEDSDSSVRLLLEPGDSDVQFLQLIGPTDRAVRIMQTLEPCRIELLMDISHIRQLDEQILPALSKAHGLCHHVHLANCILKKNHPMYGDKHPLFGAADGEVSIRDAESILKAIREHYAGEAVTVSVEIINHKNDPAFARAALENVSWFFQNE